MSFIVVYIKKFFSLFNFFEFFLIYFNLLLFNNTAKIIIIFNIYYMKYIKYLKENISDELKNEVLDKTEGAIVELLDKDFSITCEIEDCETYYSIDLKIQPPYVQKFDYYWDNIKENILFLTKILNNDYIINMVTIRLADGAPYYIEGDIEKKNRRFILSI